jgi:hypothetical protein
MRPDSIRWFGAGYLLWLVAQTAFNLWAVGSRIILPRMHALPGWFVFLTAALLALHLGLNLILRHYIVARPLPIARTIFTVLMVIGWGFFFYVSAQSLMTYRSFPITTNMGFMMLSLAAQLGLMWLLFRPDAGAWLRGEAPEPAEALEDTFR